MTLSDDLDALYDKLHGLLDSAFVIAGRVVDALEPAEQATEPVPNNPTQAQMVEAIARYRERYGADGVSWRRGIFDNTPEYIREEYVKVSDDIKAAVLREVTL